MNDTCSTRRVSRLSARIAIVLSLLLAAGAMPIAAFAAPRTVSDVEATYLDSATINLMATGAIAKTYSQLDGGAVLNATSATTSLYGAHVLRFWSTDTSGGVESTVTAPFFVDDSVPPTVVSDLKSAYTTSARIRLTATDNFNGSGVDFLCYRVDGGRILTVMSPASVTAIKLLTARIAAVTSNVAVARVLSIGPSTPPPPNHYGNNCVTCHDIVIPSPEPTTTPEPTGTPIPAGGLNCDVVVNGAGPHTIEYWTQDIARNATKRVVKTLAVGRVATSTSLKRNVTSLRSGGYVTLTAKLNAANGGTFTNTYMRFEVKRRGTTRYVLLKNVKVRSNGSATYWYKVVPKGTCYYRVRFLGNTTYLPAPLRPGISLFVR